MIKKINTLENLKINKKYNTVVLGYFDGVHKGHQKLLEVFENLDSDELGAVITFEFKKNKNKNLLNIKERINKIEAQLKNKNFDILILTLEPAIINNTKEEFIDFLKQLDVRSIIVGNDYRFGKGASGSISNLKENFAVEIVDFILDENDEKISTTKIKKKLNNYQLSQAELNLGYEYFVDGEVQYGKALGRTIGFRTANIIPLEFLPAIGVYITSTVIDGKIYPSVTNIGKNPTINDRNNKLICETHVLDSFSKDLYNKKIRVIFKRFLRSEKKFDNIEELKTQIKRDVQNAEKYYKN